MDVLIRYGFTIDEIKLMMDTNQEIEMISDNDILSLISILKDVGCSDTHIKNIFLCNPFYLSKDYDVVLNLINKFKELEISNLFILFDSNPFILNHTSSEIDDVYKNMLEKGLKLDNILDYFHNNIVF